MDEIKTDPLQDSNLVDGYRLLCHQSESVQLMTGLRQPVSFITGTGVKGED